jgi:hypothetical protein
MNGPSANPDTIRVVGSGSYLIAHNSIDCGWADGVAIQVERIPPGTVAGRRSSALMKRCSFSPERPRNTIKHVFDGCIAGQRIAVADRVAVWPVSRASACGAGQTARPSAPRGLVRIR